MATVISKGTIPLSGAYKKASPSRPGGVDEEIWDKAYAVYQQSERVKAAAEQRDAANAAVSGYKRNPALINVQNNIANRPKFDYDYSKDPLYQQYKDSYTRQGQAAMRDTVAQAAALTGGYGNSYAQSAGQQAYNGYMQQLNDKIPELEQRAFDRYTAEGDDLYRLYSLLYGEERDALGDLRSDRDYYSGEYWRESADDYSKFTDERSNALNIAGMQNGEYWNDKNFNYQVERDAAADALARDQLAEQKRQNAIANEQWERDYALSLAAGSGGSGGLFTYAGTDPDNPNKSLFYDSEGKLRSYDRGINPYTGNYNKDWEGNTFSNGYQPNKIGDKKLIASGYKDNKYGADQNVWLDGEGDDAKAWYWNGRTGEYGAYSLDGKNQATKADIYRKLYGDKALANAVARGAAAAGRR